MPYFLAGSGHLVSAKAIAHYLRTKKPDWDIRFLEPADEFESNDLDGFFRRSWHFALKKPRMAAILFLFLDKLFPFIPIAINTYIMRKSLPATRKYLADYDPDLIITTHWGCGHLFQSTRLEYGFTVPLLMVRNDLGGAFQIQDCGCDYTFVMSSLAKQAFMNLGVLDDRIIQVNPLVRPEFLSGVVSQADARDGLAIDPDKFTVLMSAGGEGFGQIEQTARTVLKVADNTGADIQMLIITGRNEALRKQLQQDLLDPRIVLFGYREDMHVLMAASDIVVGKCGANYTMETVMMRRPFLVTQVGAPNEEFNKEFIVLNKYGWYAPTRDSLTIIFTMILSDKKVLNEVNQRLNLLPTVSGAEQIADRIIAELSITKI